MESDDCVGIIHHGCFKDFPGFDDDRVQVALAQDMEAEESVFGVERNDPEFFNGFSFEVEEDVQQMVAGRRAGDREVQIIAVVGYAVLF